MPDRGQFRDTGRYLAAVASEVVAPVLRAYAGSRARGPVVTPREWRRGVIVGSGHIGDVLYRTCSLELLAHGLPQCRWTYVTTEDGAEVLLGNPALVEVLPFNRETASDFAPPYSAADLRTRDFDVALCTDNIEHHRALRMVTDIGIPNRVAFVQKGFSGLATVPIRPDRASWPAQFRTMVNCITALTDATPLRPRMYLTETDRSSARAEWESLPYSDASLTVSAAVTTRQRVGLIPRALFVAILRHVLEIRPETRIVLSGIKSDAAELQTVASELGARALVRPGTLSLRSFAAFLELCDGFLGPDSGPRHLANAAGIPVFFVRNLAAPEIETGRYCESETDIAPHGQYLSSADAARCLESVDPAYVAQALVAAAVQHRALRG